MFGVCATVAANSLHSLDMHIDAQSTGSSYLYEFPHLRKLILRGDPDSFFYKDNCGPWPLPFLESFAWYGPARSMGSPRLVLFLSSCHFPLLRTFLFAVQCSGRVAINALAHFFDATQL
jgi:hypothetical protein